MVSGYMFRKGRMKVTVSKIFKVNSSEPISQSYLVELSVLAPTGQDVIADDMRIFAEQLKPLVQLEKIDYKRFAQMPWIISFFINFVTSRMPFKKTLKSN